MQIALTTAFLAFVGSVAAAATDGPYSIGAGPAGFDKGTLNTTLKCNVKSTGLNLKDQVINFGVSAILPNQVNSGQSFDVIAGTRLIVPASLNSIVSGFGASEYGGQATKVIVNAKGGSPSSIDAASTPITIPNAKINKSGPTVLEVPGKGGIVKVGPFKGGSAGTIVFSFGDIEATIKTFDASGKPTFITADVTCPAQPVSLAFVTTNGKGSSTSRITPTNGGKISTIPANSTAGISSFNYKCNFDGFGSETVRISVGGVKLNSNQAIKSGGSAVLSKAQGNIFLNDALVSKVKGKYSSASKFSLNIKTLDLSATNASPSKINAIPSGGVKSPVQALSASAVVAIPNGAPSKTLPDIKFTVQGASGSTSLLSLTDAAGSVTVYDSSSKSLATIDFTCPALSPAVPLFPFDLA